MSEIILSVLIGCQATISNQWESKISVQRKFTLKNWTNHHRLGLAVSLTTCKLRSRWRLCLFWLLMHISGNIKCHHHQICNSVEAWIFSTRFGNPRPSAIFFFLQGWKIVDGSIREIRLDRKICFEIFFGFRTLEIVVTDVSSLGWAISVKRIKI